MRYSVTAYELDTATQATIAALESLNLQCYLVGSVACSAYGMSRTPNDIDMVVLHLDYTQEQLKDLLVQKDHRFYLIASKDPLATYRVLWFRLSGYRRSCKVDLLLPGIMNIPYWRYSLNVVLISSPSSTYSSADYPLMPFLSLLLLKLQAWQDHGESPKMFMQQKQPTDVQDIKELLQLAEQKYAIGDKIPHLPQSFIQAANIRVRKFARMHPWSKNQWRMIGFKVDSSATIQSEGQSDVQRPERMMSSLVLNF
ncbi:hypothetical protein J3R30DRAFT_3301493 [Lentinula aciculospora]|uniref:Uncharacterized protein n=1 Tax=Lentinula aciculospora TaxID=153920 RepID=A0A9W8ZZL6_9AGAR|nr:hypothetical protein J3R30DRAFT_3301493 [Lentinula aciculospora]